ncbi:glucosyl hydrolase [Rhizobium sp. AQ_MP]|jgi:hypothetical protein|uniref:glucosyl hydrolase n=1 Tax=Rhizobium sp. AQ_MP TaxID=2761536 RepID=UPI00163A9F23|nr:glucosyl hydrolase [Rhizobium sp. AQ_MP]MBC2774690.1 glucosyl hydrolase [Rhizobium sp. AQ_MP]
MRWARLGQVFNAEQRSSWMDSYAYVPTAYQIDEERIRVFLAFRDKEQVGRIGWVDVLANDPTQVIEFSREPSLDIGRVGAFDDNGVTPLAVVAEGTGLRLYYAGWQLTPRARYLLFTGLAISTDQGQRFTRLQETPILDRSPDELILRSGAHVLKDEEMGIWKMWYAVASGFVDVGGKQVPTYHMAYLESVDGISWPQKGKTVLTPLAPDEYGFGRSFIRKKNGRYELWLSARSHSKNYVIDYATSADGVHWQRHAGYGGLDHAAEGWDSQMTCFPSIIENKHGTFMFYNGNGFGETGFGVAKLVE